jgi:hypothetical protein
MRVAVRRGAATALALAVTLAIGGCGGDDKKPTAQSTSGSATPSPTPSGPPPLATTLKVGQVVGHLGKDRREAVSRQVGSVVDHWIDHAYVGGDYPRKDFSGSFAGFTLGAMHEARHDQALMTNARLGDRITGVQAKRRDVSLDVLAPRGTPAGVTAHVHLAFVTSGKPDQRVWVRGRLLFTHDDKRGWQVFAYDIARGVTK